MKMTLDMIASAIQNNVLGGLKGVTNFSYSIEQLRDEVGVMRNAVLRELSMKGLLRPDSVPELAQRINCVPVRCRDISDCCSEVADYYAATAEKATVYHAQLPALAYLAGISPILYLGKKGMQRPFKVWYDQSWAYNQYEPATSRRPFVWVEGQNAWFFNQREGLEEISIRAVFEDVSAVERYDCCEKLDQAPFPAPDYIIQLIIHKLSEQYLRYYRLAHVQPNVQADLPPPAPAQS
jgi:hypothetical protein